MSGEKYHKIDSIYKRDDRGNFVLGEYSRPEFEYLAGNLWEWTEKIDGTNIRVSYFGDELDNTQRNIGFAGRTDNAQIPANLFAKLMDLFFEKDVSYPGSKWFDKFGRDDVTLYGEGYGAKIQKGGGDYIPDGVGFILFDVKIGNFWLNRESVEDIAKYFGVPSVPVRGYLTIENAIMFVEKGIHSYVAQNPNKMAEGLIGTPLIPLFARNGDRIITKIKTRDFKEIK